MSVLCAPTGSEGVQEYRFRQPRLGQVYYDGDIGAKMAKWLDRNGMAWDAFWTNAYSEGAKAIAQVMRDYDIPVVIDVDDYFDEVPTGNVAHRAWFGKKKSLYNQQLTNADRRVASTPWLADFYKCSEAPNFVVPEYWDCPTRENDESVTLLHAGSVGRAEDYLDQQAAFERFLGLPNTKIIFVGWIPSWAKEWPLGKVVFCRWVEWSKYGRMLRWLNPDITVSPMIHNKFNLAKSNIKWLEAGMMNACFVGERWGEYERTVEDGTTGVLASGSTEWGDRLCELAQDSDLRQRIASAGRDRVLSDWTWEAVEDQWRHAVLGV